MPRTTAPSTNPRILSGYTPYPEASINTLRQKGSTTTTEERRQLLVNDPQARDVLPEQVTCTRCSKTVRLQKGKAYHLSHWLDHRWRCDKAVTENPPPRAKSRTLLERKALLEADPDARNVEAGRVNCRKCDKEVKFRKGRPYGLSGWLQHKESCSNINLSAIPASATAPPSPASSARRTAPNLDPVVAENDSHRVRCARCHSWVELSPQTEQDANIWRRHRESCASWNMKDDNKPGSTRARFFRPQHRLEDAASRDSSVEPVKSLVTDDIPRRPLRPYSPREFIVDDQRKEESPVSTNSPPTAKTRDSPVNHRLGFASEESSSERATFASPPPLSFSEVTSADTSAACTPMTSPRRTYNLPSIRHRALPEFTPLSLSRFVIDKPESEHTVGALGLRLSETQLSEDSPPPPRTRSPPPYLERTRLSLPMPARYWRFEGID